MSRGRWPDRLEETPEGIGNPLLAPRCARLSHRVRHSPAQLDHLVEGVGEPLVAAFSVFASTEKFTAEAAGLGPKPGQLVAELVQVAHVVN